MEGIFLISLLVISFAWFIQALIFLFGFVVEFTRCTTEEQENIVKDKWKLFYKWFQITNVAMILMFIIFLIILGNIK